MDGHPQVTVVLFPCSPVFSQGFKEATMRITSSARTLHVFLFSFVYINACFLLRYVARGGSIAVRTRMRLPIHSHRVDSYTASR